MKLIVVVSLGMGMMFNNRRLSKDEELRKHILNMTKGNRLFVSEYTAKQFNHNDDIIVDNNCLENATDDDYVFVEDLNIIPYIDKIDVIYLYQWDRKYPFDTVFPITLAEWRAESYVEFVGKSHKNIGCIKYVKRKHQEYINLEDYT